MDAKTRLAEAIDSKAALFTSASDAVWDYAETQFTLKRSADALTAAAEKEGFRVTRGLAGMDDAFVAEYGSGAPVIAILGEYDALENMNQIADIAEKKASVPGGPGHGCGHNLLGAGALAAAVGVKEIMKADNLKGTIRFYGCPAEEGGHGKAHMAKGGAFDGVDAALSWHPDALNAAWAMSCLAITHMYFHFKGTSSHAGATPHLGRSALDAAELMNVGVNFLREHIIDAARIHYAFLDAGGGSANIVQPTASLYYFVRAPKMRQALEILERVKKIAAGAALMTETEVTMEPGSACYNYIPNRTLTTLMHANIRKAMPSELPEEERTRAEALHATVDEETRRGLAERLRRIYPDWTEEKIASILALPVRRDVEPLDFNQPPVTASTDVGDVSWLAPTAQALFACYVQGTAAHSWQWVASGKSELAHRGMLAAGKAIGFTALDLLLDPALIDKVKQEHQANLGDETYVPRIPDGLLPQ